MFLSSRLHTLRLPRLPSILRRDPRPALFLAVQIVALGHLATTHIAEVGLCIGPSMLPTLAPDAGILLYVRLPFLALLQTTFSRFHSTVDHLTTISHHRDTEGFTLHSSKSLSKRTCGLPLYVGDIVVAAGPHDPYRQVCKRILGLPGDRVLIEPRQGYYRRMADAGARILEQSPGYDGQQQRKRREEVWSSSNNDDDNRNHIPSSSKVQQEEEEVQDPDEDYFTVPPGHVWLAGDNLQNSTDSRDHGPVPMGCLRGKVVARVWPYPKVFPSAAIPISSDRPPISGLLTWLPMAPTPSSPDAISSVRP